MTQHHGAHGLSHLTAGTVLQDVDEQNPGAKL